MGKRSEPRIKGGVYSLERESNLAVFRLKKGYTEAQLAELVGSSQATLNALSIGKTAPVHVRGEKAGAVKDVVLKLEEALGVSAAELFPAYICGIDSRELLDESATDLSMGGWSVTAGEVDLEMFEHVVETKKALWEAVRRLPVRLKVLVLSSVIGGTTLETFAEEEKVSRECIRQRKSKALDRLRMYFLQNLEALADEPNIPVEVVPQKTMPIFAPAYHPPLPKAVKRRGKYKKRAVPEDDYLLGLI